MCKVENKNLNNENIGKLKKNPMFQLSLSSKELFHSNFIYWLYEIKPEAFKKLCENLGADTEEWGDEYTVYREKNHYDLSVDKGGKPIFILENKVKSLPDIEQLNKYQEENESADCILLSLVDTPEIRNKVEKNAKPWKFVSYSEFANKLDTTKDSFPEKYKTYISDYIEFIRSLSKLVRDAVSKKSLENYFYNDVEMKQLEELRIDDIVQKLRSSEILSKLENRIKENDKLKDLKLEYDKKIEEIFKKEYTNGKYIFLGTGYTNGNALFEVKIKVTDDTVLLIQIQGNQYRRGVQYKDQSKKKNAVFKYVIKNYSDLFSKDQTKENSKILPKHKVFCEPPTKRINKDYNIFNPNILYQYENITKGAKTNDIIEGIIEDITTIIKKFNGEK